MNRLIFEVGNKTFTFALKFDCDFQPVRSK